MFFLRSTFFQLSMTGCRKLGPLCPKTRAFSFKSCLSNCSLACVACFHSTPPSLHICKKWCWQTVPTTSRYDSNVLLTMQRGCFFIAAGDDITLGYMVHLCSVTTCKEEQMFHHLTFKLKNYWPRPLILSAVMDCGKSWCALAVPPNFSPSSASSMKVSKVRWSTMGLCWAASPSPNGIKQGLSWPPHCSPPS